MEKIFIQKFKQQKNEYIVLIILKYIEKVYNK